MPPVGSRGKALGQGDKVPLKLSAFLLFRRLICVEYAARFFFRIVVYKITNRIIAILCDILSCCICNIIKKVIILNNFMINYCSY